jgi:hypothetical protein
MPLPQRRERGGSTCVNTGLYNNGIFTVKGL